MANINLSNLNNAEALNLTVGNFSTSGSAVNALIDTSQNEVGNFWFSSSILLIFLIFNWYFYRKDANFQLDISRSILISSGWSFFISAGFLLGGLITTIYPILWFSSLTLLSWASVKNLQRRGA